MEICNNDGFLRALYFVKLLMDVIFTLAPIGLIIMGTIDLSKAVASGDENEQKKSRSIFVKRLIYAFILFAVPWIVNAFMTLLGNFAADDKESFINCYNKANSSIRE